jgi:hypothetical protein
MALNWGQQNDVGEQRLIERAVGDFSRRQLLRDAAVAFGGLAGAGLVDPTSVLARANPAPRPIPGGLDRTLKPVPRDAFVHVLSPGIGSEMSTITDLNGVVAGSETRGKARGSDGSTWEFDTDMRFMAGTYVGTDGRRRQGAFGFI